MSTRHNAILNYKRLSLVVLAVALMATSPWASGQGAADPDDTDVVEDEFNRGTPLRSANGFLSSADAGDYETAAEYLDLRNLRGEAGALTAQQLARRLDVIAQRADWVDIDELVDEAGGRSGDGLPDYRDSIGVILADGNEVRLLMQRVPRGDGDFIWKISNATVSQIPALYEIFGYPRLIEDLRRSLPDVSYLGYELFKWVVVLVIGVSVYGAVFLLSFLVWRTLADRQNSTHQRIFRFFVVPFGIWCTVLAMNLVASTLGRGVTAEMIQRVTPIPTLITVWITFASINLFRDIYAAHLEKKERSGGAVLLRPAGNAIKLIVTVVATLAYLDQLGINITTVLAGLGVGGIAVALALQKPMEDVFGAITLYSQQPIRVGDFCRVGEATGTIEEIGLRTTYIRTLANTRIAVPNSRLANEPIDNISARQRILYRSNLRLRYDTKPEQIRQLLESVREMLKNDKRVLEDGQRVRLVEITDDALRVEVYAHLDTTVWVEYLELAEELNLRILEIVDEAGTSLALPTSTLHLEQNDSPVRAS